MQFQKNTSRDKSKFIPKLIVKSILVLFFLFIVMLLVDRIDFPAPNKKIEKTIKMKTLRLLNKKYFAIILSLSLLNFASQSNEPVDIWNLENKEVSKEEITSENAKENEILLNSVYKMQSQKKKI